MRDLKTFRLVNKIETTMIYDSLTKISPDLLPFFKKNNYRLYISLNKLEAESKFPSIFLISENQSIILEKVLKAVIVRSAGVYFGFIKKGIFFLSLEGVEFFHNHDKIPKSKQVIVNKEGEREINSLWKQYFKKDGKNDAFRVKKKRFSGCLQSEQRNYSYS
jgi:hypothetical protein